MKFSWNWLSEFVDLDGVDPAQLADRFTLAIAELEGVETIGKGLRDILIGRIERVQPHPDADKLQIVEVTVRGRLVRGVSGAPNLVVGGFVPVALPGTTLPGGRVVEVVSLRGVQSELVLLSERELGLSDDHSGVMLLDAPPQRSDRFTDGVPIEDTLFEVDNKSITHRPDLWGHWGMAREIAALVGRPMKPVVAEHPSGGADRLDVSVEDPVDCPRYMAMCLENLTVRPSPFWLRHRLTSVGVRPISNVVDATNAVMLATGNPLHAFDRRQVHGDVIRVRRAVAGEQMTTLDGTPHALSGDDLLITDAQGPIALAGVMGGLHSQIEPDTTRVVLEAATFHPGLIRRTSVRHGLRTDASARFEKSLDPTLPQFAMAMFTRLMMQLDPGVRPSSPVFDVDHHSTTRLQIRVSPDDIARRLGTPVPAQRTRAILESLDFGVSEEGGDFVVTVPTFRATRDIGIREDLVEEIGRIIGYDNIPPQPVMAPVTLVGRQPRRHLVTRVKEILAHECGLDEVCTYSFDSRAVLGRLGYEPEAALTLKNSLSSDMVSLRTDLMPSLLAALERNATRLNEFGFFEVARVFFDRQDATGTMVQPNHVGMVLYDRNARDDASALMLFRRAKGIVAHLFDRLDVTGGDLVSPCTTERPWVHPARQIAIRVGERTLGYLCGLHPATMGALDCLGSAVVAEFDVETLLELPVRPRRFTDIPKVPAITVDITVHVARRVAAADVQRLIGEHAGEHLVEVAFVTDYIGASVPEGCKALTFRLTYRAADRTLSQNEVDAEAVRTRLQEAVRHLEA